MPAGEPAIGSSDHASRPSSARSRAETPSRTRPEAYPRLLVRAAEGALGGSRAHRRPIGGSIACAGCERLKRRVSRTFPGIWSGCLKGFQPCHQLIAMTAKSSARHKLIRCSPRFTNSTLQPWARVTPAGSNNNEVSVAWPAERNSGMDDCDRVDAAARRIGACFRSGAALQDNHLPLELTFART